MARREGSEDEVLMFGPEEEARRGRLRIDESETCGGNNNSLLRCPGLCPLLAQVR